MKRSTNWLGRLLIAGGFILLTAWGWLNWQNRQPEPAANLPVLADTPSSTPLAVANSINSATFTPIPVFTNTPNAEGTIAPLPTQMPTPTGTPTSKPQPIVTMATFIPGFATEVPETTPVPTLELEARTINVLLIGLDGLPEGDAVGTERTDTLILVSINLDTATAGMMSIPRDLTVSIPGWRSERINTAYAHGNAVNYPGGGVQLLKDTIIYNFGIPVHYYATIDFDGFTSIIDAIGGVTVTNTCELTDWRLIEPGMDITIEENYELVTLPAGVHRLNGFEALWYARSRKGSSDFDRSRRQQQVLSAMLDTGASADLLPELPQLWSAYQDTIDTDMDIGRIFQVVSLASEVRENGITFVSLQNGSVVYVEQADGTQGLVLNPAVLDPTLARLFEENTVERGRKNLVRINVVNRSGNPDMGLILADLLRTNGFVITAVSTEDETLEWSRVTYHNETAKGNRAETVGQIIEVSPDQFITDTDGADVDYTLEIGRSFSGCR